jgi:hypothetical protein
VIRWALRHVWLNAVPKLPSEILHSGESGHYGKRVDAAPFLL